MKRCPMLEIGILLSYCFGWAIWVSPLLYLSRTHQIHTRSYRVSCLSSPFPSHIAVLLRNRGGGYIYSLFLKYGFQHNMLSGLRLLLQLFLKYCFYIFLMYRPTRKRLTRRRRPKPPTRAVATAPRPLPPGGAADSAEAGASPTTLRSV
jgi:hypothetical protein